LSCCTEVVTDYPEKLAMLDEANKSIQQLREDNNNYQDREQFYQKLNHCLNIRAKPVVDKVTHNLCGSLT
jgi:hypothetical protein